eukprot:3525528-Rhodomonas_salina.2
MGRQGSSRGSKCAAAMPCGRAAIGDGSGGKVGSYAMDRASLSTRDVTTDVTIATASDESILSSIARFPELTTDPTWPHSASALA